MTRRQLGVVFGLLAALVGVWLSVQARSPSSENRGTGLDLGAMIDRDVSRVSITPPDTSAIRLQLVDGRWTVNGYPAQDSLVEVLLTRLDTVPPARLVARSPVNHERLGVDAETARRIEIGLAGRPDAVFLLGGSGPEGRFIRLPDHPEVYVVPAVAVLDLDRNEFRWRDPTVVTVDTASLSRLVVHRGPDPSVEVIRDSLGVWQVDGTPADTAVMRTLLATVADLQATGFPADSFVYAVDFDRPDAILDLHLGTNPTDAPYVSLLFASVATRSDVLVRRANDPIVYAIDSRRANLLTAGRTRLLGSFQEPVEE